LWRRSSASQKEKGERKGRYGLSHRTEWRKIMVEWSRCRSVRDIARVKRKEEGKGKEVQIVQARGKGGHVFFLLLFCGVEEGGRCLSFSLFSEPGNQKKGGCCSSSSSPLVSSQDQGALGKGRMPDRLLSPSFSLSRR